MLMLKYARQASGEIVPMRLGAPDGDGNIQNEG